MVSELKRGSDVFMWAARVEVGTPDPSECAVANALLSSSARYLRACDSSFASCIARSITNQRNQAFANPPLKAEDPYVDCYAIVPKRTHPCRVIGHCPITIRDLSDQADTPFR